MIPILEFSSTEHRDIRPGYPVPNIFSPGWHCSICGEPVPDRHSAYHMHEVGPRHIGGAFCATNDADIPDHADEIRFAVDDLIITLTYAEIRPSPNINGNKIVSSAIVDAQCKRYYTFEASSIEYDTGEERGKNDEEMPI